MRLRRVVDVLWLPVSAPGQLDLPEAARIVELTFESALGPGGPPKLAGAWIEVLVQRYKEPMDMAPTDQVAAAPGDDLPPPQPV